MRKADPQAERRASILGAATGIFLRYGFKKTSMDDVARAADLSRQGLYLHYPTKESLFQAVVRSVIEGQRVTARGLLTDESMMMNERLLAAFDALHGCTIRQPGSEHVEELFQAATQLVGPITELEDSLVADLSSALRGKTLTDRFRAAGVTARQVAATLYTTSYGWKHRATTQAAYREHMRIAIQIACGPAKARAKS